MGRAYSSNVKANSLELVHVLCTVYPELSCSLGRRGTALDRVKTTAESAKTAEALFMLLLPR